MAHYRSTYRAQALAALAAHEHFAGFTMLKVWSGSVDDDTLPVIGVLTPQERVDQVGKPSTARRTTLQVGLRRRGFDDVEDQLDEDSELIEAIICATFLSQRQACFLEETSVVANTDGRANIGTLVMTFRLSSWRPIPTVA